METKLFDLSGKTALVTGGGRGIGLAIAQGLAEHGADIALISRTKDQLDTAAKQIQADTGQNVRTFPFDMENIGQIETLFENITAETNGIDILVNCAGTTIRGPAEDELGEGACDVSDAEPAVECSSGFRVVGPADIAHDHQIGRRVQMPRVVAVETTHTPALEGWTDGRVEGKIAAAHLMAQLGEQTRE